MAAKSIYKVNGKTFYNYADVTKYLEDNNFRVSNTQSSTHNGVRINLIDVTSI